MKIETPADAKGAEQYIADLQATGDLMQSSLSRVLAFIDSYCADIHSDDYEAFMATLEGASAVDLWTEIRRAVASR